jgi:hypothetical protein
VQLPSTLGNDSRYLSVDLELANGTDAAAPLAFALFAVRTSSGLQLSATAETALRADGCLQNASVSPHERTRCQVVFVMPKTDTATAVVYTIAAPPSANGEPQTATVTIQMERCTECAGECVDTQWDDAENCGACANPAGLGECAHGKAVCSPGALLCGATSVDPMTDAKNCGACGVVAGGETQCRAGKVMCGSIGSAGMPRLACGGLCVDPVDSAHCGSCTRDCGGTSVPSTCAVGNDFNTSDVSASCTTNDKAPAACTAKCGRLACNRAEAFYVCPTTGAGVIEIGCTNAPAPTIIPDGQTENCTFEHQECSCG